MALGLAHLMTAQTRVDNLRAEWPQRHNLTQKRWWRYGQNEYLDTAESAPPLVGRAHPVLTASFSARDVVFKGRTSGPSAERGVARE